MKGVVLNLYIGYMTEVVAKLQEALVKLHGEHMPGLVVKLH